MFQQLSNNVDMFDLVKLVAHMDCHLVFCSVRRPVIDQGPVIDQLVVIGYLLSKDTCNKSNASLNFKGIILPYKH